MKNRTVRKWIVFGLCLGCWTVAAGFAMAEEGAETQTQTEEETETEQSAEKLPEDGILYYNIENPDKGAIRLVEEDGKTYVRYGDEEEETETSAPEEASDAAKEGGSEEPETETEEPELLLFEEPETYYVTTALNMRALPDANSEIVQILQIEQKINVYAQMQEKWYLAGTEKGFGFVSKKYLTDSAEEAAQAMKAEEAAQQAAALAAQQAAAAAARQKASSSGGSGGGGKKEVSRENVPNCDDASHGTTYITYSDGSVKVVGY